MFKNTFRKFINNKKVVNKNKAYSKLLPLKSLPCSFLFVHIPKTAGTSFRQSTEAQYPSMNDYGKESNHTSEIIKDYCYNKRDMHTLKKIFSTKKYFLSGHFPSQKYIDFVDTRHIISFVRDPLEQVISHYNHSVKYLGYEGEFDEFIVITRHNNIQKRYLNSLPVSLYGFIGLTSSYDESLSFINEAYDLNVEVKHSNVGHQKTQTQASLTSKQREIIETSNFQDVILLNQVKTLFKERLTFQKNKEPWVHGWGNITQNNIIEGCAYYEKNDEAVQLMLLINNKITNEFIANEFTGLFSKAKLPRDRYVGFHVNLNDYNHVKEIQLKVKETGQIIFEHII
jgi:hypothetical protein